MTSGGIAGQGVQAGGYGVAAELLNPLVQFACLPRPAEHGRGQYGADEVQAAAERCDPLRGY